MGLKKKGLFQENHNAIQSLNQGLMKLLTPTRSAFMLQAACMLLSGIFIPFLGPAVMAMTGGHLHLSLLKHFNNKSPEHTRTCKTVRIQKPVIHTEHYVFQITCEWKWNEFMVKGGCVRIFFFFCQKQKGVFGLSAVKPSIFTVWKSGCTVCSPLPSMYESQYRLQRPASSLGSWGQQQIQLVSTRHWRSQQNESWLEKERERGSRVGGRTHKGQVSRLLLFQWATTWRLKG